MFKPAIYVEILILSSTISRKIATLLDNYRDKLKIFKILEIVFKQPKGLYVIKDET